MWSDFQASAPNKVKYIFNLSWNSLGVVVKRANLEWKIKIWQMVSQTPETEKQNRKK